jgi:hypothetical protein
LSYIIIAQKLDNSFAFMAQKLDNSFAFLWFVLQVGKENCLQPNKMDLEK